MAGLKFKNKIAIITGSSHGIGKATALQLCKDGATVVLNGRNPENLENTRIEFSELGYNVIAIAGDVTSHSDCEYLINETIKTFGKIDILINNGSSTMTGKIKNMPPEIFLDIFKSNSFGAVLPTLIALPHIMKTKGSVIFISSLGGLHSFPSASAYCMGKMALTALWQSLKIEMSESGVHFGICYLSYTKNEETKRMLNSEGKLVPVPQRPKFFQRSREKVAMNISSIIKRRKSKKIVSPLGYISSFIIQHFPRTFLFLITQYQKKAMQSKQAIKIEESKTSMIPQFAPEQVEKTQQVEQET